MTSTPDPIEAIPAGTGTLIADWTIAAMRGDVEATVVKATDAEGADLERSRRRVVTGVVALRSAVEGDRRR